MNIVITIIPIFTIILIGWFAKNKSFMPPEFLGPANRLVYYLAIPAMIFRSVSKGSLTTRFNFEVIFICLCSVLAVFALSWGAGVIAKIRHDRRGTLIQSSFHGNLGYIGLAVTFYYLGNEGLGRASIIAGFIMILQNFLAVFVLQFHADDPRSGKSRLVLKVMGNPIIISAVAGILFSLSGLPMPVVIGRSLDILSGMSLPMALLLIGASLSFKASWVGIGTVLLSGFMKLMILPCIGFVLYLIAGSAPQDYVPGLILLASPTATVTFIMAKEMGGDADFAVTAISISTILSSLTFCLWLNIV
ncbi:MAG: AEC family transporter [Desulfobacterales bacterium]|nr:AEC family transporter [Desulfobacterales bacterium]